MIGKFMVRGRDRPEAMERMLLELEDFVATGVNTTLRFSKAIAGHPDFQRAAGTAAWLENVFAPQHRAKPVTGPSTSTTWESSIRPCATHRNAFGPRA